MKPKPVSESYAVLSHLMGVTDANNVGNIHGGIIMKLVDEAAGLAAIKHSGRLSVTAGIDRMNFMFPIHLGEVVTFRASVNAAWRTSMEVGVKVEAENPLTGAVRHTNTAYLTMVSLDQDGHPAPVPPLLASTPAERRRMREAEMRRANRLAERAAMLAHEAEPDA